MPSVKVVYQRKNRGREHRRMISNGGGGGLLAGVNRAKKKVPPRPGEHTLAATLGAIYTFDEHWSLKAAVSHSLREADQPGPRPAVVFYVVWNF